MFHQPLSTDMNLLIGKHPSKNKVLVVILIVNDYKYLVYS